VRASHPVTAGRAATARVCHHGEIGCGGNATRGCGGDIRSDCGDEAGGGGGRPFRVRHYTWCALGLLLRVASAVLGCCWEKYSCANRDRCACAAFNVVLHCVLIAGVFRSRLTEKRNFCYALGHLSRTSRHVIHQKLAPAFGLTSCISEANWFHDTAMTTPGESAFSTRSSNFHCEFSGS